jgi:hypothetical protein
VARVASRSWSICSRARIPATSEVAREPERSVGGDRARVAKDPADAVARHTDRLGEATGAEPERLEELLLKDDTGWIGPTGAASESTIEA